MTIDQPLDTVDMMLNMGPQHPSTHGVFRMVLTVDGENIVDVVPHIGYLHRGSEKLCEAEDYRQIIDLFDRLDYVSSFNNELPYVMAVEKLMGLEVPERAQYIRLIMCELNRIASHLLFYGAFGADCGAITPFLYGFREREQMQALFESVSGARMMHGYFRVGGVFRDLPDDFNQRLDALLPVLEKGITECEDLLSKNELFLERTIGVGVIDAETAIDFGVTGPNLRASGLAYDLRKDDPYLLYPRFDFNVPVGASGDCFDRYMVRMEEMWESIKIVKQAVAQMPSGPIMAKTPRTLRPPKGDVYVRTENPRGEMGVYLVSEGKDKPHRIKMRTPSFCNLVALRHMLIGSYLADSVVILGSIDIVLGDVDR